MHEYVMYERLNVVNLGMKLLNLLRLAESVAPTDVRFEPRPVHRLYNLI
jgi:hypothetical protein